MSRTQKDSTEDQRTGQEGAVYIVPNSSYVHDGECVLFILFNGHPVTVSHYIMYCEKLVTGNKKVSKRGLSQQVK